MVFFLEIVCFDFQVLFALGRRLKCVTMRYNALPTMRYYVSFLTVDGTSNVVNI